MKLGKGIVDDVKARLPWYVSDWKEGFNSGYRIFAPAVYIFFASFIPALAFGEQIENDTDANFNGVHVLVASAIGGTVQAIVGGQPLLILGVAAPIVLMYTFMYEFAKSQDFEDVFVPWCTWMTMWMAFFIFVLAFTGTCQALDKFTRFSGELFGLLIALLFTQQSVRGVVQEFRIERACVADSPDGAPLPDGCEPYSPTERLASGLWAMVLSVGMLAMSLWIYRARSWRFLRGGLRSFLADYGVPLMVVVWSAVSFAAEPNLPSGLPRRLSLPDPWDAVARRNWTVVSRLGDVSGVQIGYAAIPGFITALLFYFDHNVSTQLAQQPDFQLVRPTAYNYDFALVGVLTLLCGFLGIPPVNCVIPQAPMHTRSLMTLKKLLLNRDAKKRSEAELRILEQSKAGLSKAESRANLDALDAVYEPPQIRLHNGVFPLQVKEQRMTNLIQSLLIGACVAGTPALRQIPKSVLWGYFSFMAIESLPGNEFWERLMLLATDRRKRIQMLEGEHPAYLETCQFRNIVKFTVFQLVYMLAVFGITWAGPVGISFPAFIMLLIPVRQYVMPKIFDKWTLSQLDAAEYEEAPPAPDYVVAAAARRDNVDLQSRDLDEEQERIAAEMSGFRAIKHHLTAEEMTRRTNLAFADDGAPQSPREGDDGRGVNGINHV